MAAALLAWTQSIMEGAQNKTKYASLDHLIDLANANIAIYALHCTVGLESCS